MVGGGGVKEGRKGIMDKSVRLKESEKRDLKEKL
jgi:hypothetical protein